MRSVAPSRSWRPRLSRLSSSSRRIFQRLTAFSSPFRRRRSELQRPRRRQWGTVKMSQWLIRVFIHFLYSFPLCYNTHYASQNNYTYTYNRTLKNVSKTK